MKSEINKEIVRKYFEMWNTGNIDVADDILSPDYVDVAHPEIKTVEDVKNSVLKVRNVFPDFQITIDTQICEGDTVAMMGTLSRSRQGEKLVSQIMWFAKIKNERISELRTGTVTLG